MTASRAPDPSPLRDGEPGGRRLARFATEHAVRLQRRVWSGRVVSWDQHGSSGLTKVTAALLQAAQVTPDALVVDLGCGTGQISLPLARQGAQVLAVDVSSAMIRRLQAQARRQGVQNLEARARPAARQDLAAQAGQVAAEWAPTVARVLLGLVLAWFGYHGLVQPGLWTGYVPVVPAASGLAVVLVLAHGWLLLMLAVALIAGIVPRLAAEGAAVLLLEIVVWLTATAGLSDLTLRDLGVLGLAVCLTGAGRQRLALRG